MSIGRRSTLILLFSLLHISILYAEISVAMFDAKPIGFFDEKGRATGLYPELIRAVFFEEKINFISCSSFHKAYELVLSGKADILPVIVKTDEREKLFAFNQEVVAVSWGQLFIAPWDRAESIHDLKDQKIALLINGQNGINFLNFMQGFDISFKPVYFDNMSEMTEAVLAGDVRGLVSTASFQMTDDRLKATSILFSPTQAFLAVKKGNKEWLLDDFDAALRQMKEDENSVYQREVDRLLVKEGEEVIPRWVIILILLILGIAVAGVFFHILLRIRINQIRARLQQSEAEYQGLFNAAGEAIFVLSYDKDTEGAIVDVNRSFCALTGYEKDDILTLNILEYFGGEFPEKLEGLALDLESKGFSLTEMYLPTRSGGSIHVESSFRSYKSNGGHLLLAICRDLRDRDALTSALSAVEQKYTTIADYNYDWEFWMDENATFIYLSPSCERISGYTADAFYENPDLLNSLIHPEDKEQWNRRELCEDQTRDNREMLVVRIIRKDGDVRWVEHQCLRIFSPEGIYLGIRGSFRDITRQKEMEEQLNRKQRLESLGILAGGVAHDFNNILSIIKGFSDLGMTYPSVGEEIRGMFETIYQASVRAENLTGKILDFSRNRKVELKPVRIADIIKEVHSLIKASFPSTIEIRGNLKSTDFVLADDGQIHRVIMNICTNARLAMPDGGVLTMSLETIPNNQLPDITKADGQMDWLKLSIADTGVGMDKETRARVFDPFFTTRKAGEGSGMGLSVVHGIISGWNGQLSIDSAPGKGTSFHIFLPKTATPVKKRVSQSSYEYSQNNGLVMVVDDEPLILKLIQTYMEKAGMECDCYSSADEAFDSFTENPEPFSLIVADMTMPGMRGDQLAAGVKAIRPELPIILCSGYSEYADPDNLPEGADALLGKPFSSDELLKTVGRILAVKL